MVVTVVTANNVPAGEGNDPGRFANPPPTHPALIPVLTVVATITRILIGAVAFGAFMFANMVGSSTTRQHIYLNVLGYVILMGEGILSICPYTGWTRTLPFHNRRGVHLGFQSLGSLLVIIGSVLKITSQSSHFNSAHGSLGIIALLFTIMTLIAGVWPYLHIAWGKKILTRLFHSICGALTLIVAFIALIFGIHNYYRLMGDVSANLHIALVVCTFIGLFSSAAINNLRRLS